MATIRPILDTRSVKADGTSPIKFRVSVSRSVNFLVSLDMYATPDQFDKTGGKSGNAWIKNHPNKTNYNIHIRHKLISADEFMICNHDKIRHMCMRDLRDALIGHLFASCSDDGQDDDIILLADVFLSYIELKHGRTKEIYQATFDKFKSIIPGFNKIAIDDIKKNWLDALQTKLHSINSVNTSAIDLRNLRAVFNYAIDEELITRYPFRKFKIQTEETVKRSLTPDQIKILRDYPCKGAQAEYRDLFMLIIYLAGINISDLCDAMQTDVIDGRLVYHRHKTNKLYKIKIEPEAYELINAHKGRLRLICACERYVSIKQYNRRMNEGLKRIGDVKREGRGGKITVKPYFPDISTYWARHTWATIAHKIGISKDVISMALGHSFGNRVTDTYIDFDIEKVDEANRLVIDYIKSL